MCSYQIIFFFKINFSTTFFSIFSSGPFIHYPNNDLEPPTFGDVCRFEKNLLKIDENHLVHVKCGHPKCGISKIDEKKLARSKRKAEDESFEVQAARIVGGTASLPGEFPFIVAIFKDGKFHCGGTIYNERWIITGKMVFGGGVLYGVE